MDQISRRDYFAAQANIEWIKTTTPTKASQKTGVPVPSVSPNDPAWEDFWEAVEVKWRWKYADNMLKGE